MRTDFDEQPTDPYDQLSGLLSMIKVALETVKEELYEFDDIERNTFDCVDNALARIDEVIDEVNQKAEEADAIARAKSPLEREEEYRRNLLQHLKTYSVGEIE
jgi:hypothetical protein